MEEMDNNQPADEEAEMNRMFNESILDGATAKVGRGSIANDMDFADDTDTQSVSTAAESATSEDKKSQLKQDMRKSSRVSKKANA